MLEIEQNDTTREIRVGKWIADNIYYNWPMNESNPVIKNEILKANGLAKVEPIRFPTGDDCIRYHSEIAEHLGTKFYKRLRGAMYSVWIAPIQTKANRYCFYSNGYRHYYSIIQIERLWNHISLVNQMEEDNLFHLIPIIVFFCSTPKVLKKKLGKGIWKRLCANSLNRNKLIVKSMMEKIDKKSRRIKHAPTKSRFEILKNYLAFVVTIKTSLLRSFYFVVDTDLEKQKTFWLNKYARVSDTQHLNQLGDLYRDTAQMCAQLNLEMKDWSPKKMKSQHDILAKRITAQHYSDKPFSFRPLDNGTHNGVTYQLLNSPLDVALEGRVMGHCIASYINHISQGLYVAFSLSNENIRSTLGLYYSNGKFRFDQHYGRFNTVVSDSDLIETAEHILDCLNTKAKAA